jgi:hypothetical protein
MKKDSCPVSRLYDSENTSHVSKPSSVKKKEKMRKKIQTILVLVADIIQKKRFQETKQRYVSVHLTINNSFLTKKSY